ncbi:MAG: DUF456 domain-containing protein [Pirellulales bacterium]|nr:DUF456 domain-containing protein [Pirellulales bacterium]
MSFVWAFLLVLIVLFGWLLTLVGLPGNWLMVAAVIVYALLIPQQSPAGLGWGVVAALVVLAALGELLEFLAGALGAAKAGGSRRGAVLALAGSMVGGIVGLFVGLPIPLVGSLLGAVLLAGAGAFIGAVVGEQWKGRSLDDSCRIGRAAFWGRLLGTAAKTAVGAAMVVTTIVALLV